MLRTGNKLLARQCCLCFVTRLVEHLREVPEAQLRVVMKVHVSCALILLGASTVGCTMPGEVLPRAQRVGVELRNTGTGVELVDAGLVEVPRFAEGSSATGDVGCLQVEPESSWPDFVTEIAVDARFQRLAVIGAAAAEGGGRDWSLTVYQLAWDGSLKASKPWRVSAAIPGSPMQSPSFSTDGRLVSWLENVVVGAEPETRREARIRVGDFDPTRPEDRRNVVETWEILPDEPGFQRAPSFGPMDRITFVGRAVDRTVGYRWSPGDTAEAVAEQRVRDGNVLLAVDSCVLASDPKMRVGCVVTPRGESAFVFGTGESAVPVPLPGFVSGVPVWYPGKRPPRDNRRVRALAFAVHSAEVPGSRDLVLADIETRDANDLVTVAGQPRSIPIRNDEFSPAFFAFPGKAVNTNASRPVQVLVLYVTNRADGPQDSSPRWRVFYEPAWIDDFNPAGVATPAGASL